MKLSILCLDDNLQSLHYPLKQAFPVIKKGGIPLLTGGLQQSFTVQSFADDGLEVEITANSKTQPDAILEEVGMLAMNGEYDIVLVDDDWGASGGEDFGRSELLPKAIQTIKGWNGVKELPVFVLYTQHFAQTDRIKDLCELMKENPEAQRKVTGLHKDDASGLMLLIQRVVIEKQIIEERERLATENKRLREQLYSNVRPGNMIGSSPTMSNVYRNICEASSRDITVLISGESGTGKELVAEAIHKESARGMRNAPLVAVNCSAIPEFLFESELFGHVKGAFTHAVANKPGMFELAHGGTIFLDEVGEIPLHLQAKILRVLEKKEIKRVGDTKNTPVDMRVITATNQDLNEMIKKKLFRIDLYYRLNIFAIDVPPLRDRKNDIIELTTYFLEKFEQPNTIIDKEAMDLLMSHTWPGNVRELKNVIERACCICKNEQILPEDISLSDGANSVGGGCSEDWCPNGLDKEKVGKAWSFLDLCEETASSSQEKFTQALVSKKLGGITIQAVTQQVKNMKSIISELFKKYPERWPTARNFIKQWAEIGIN